MHNLSINRWYPHRIHRFSLLLVVLSGLALRMYDLGRGTVWFDEAMEYWTASASTREIVQAVSQEIPDPPIYTFILHFWMSGGHAEAYLRLHSVIFSMLTLLGVIVAAYQLGGVWSSLLAGLLIAVSPVDIRYAQEIGQYSLYSCLVIWSANCFLLLQKDHVDWKYYSLWFASTLAAVYTHYGAIFPVIAMYLVEALIIISKRSWKRLGALAIATLLFLAGILPILLFFLPNQLARVPISGFSHLSSSSPIEILLDTLAIFSQTFSFLLTAWPFTYVPEWLPNFVVWCTIGFSLLLFKKVSRPTRIWTIWLLVLISLYLLVVQIGLYLPGFRQSMFLLISLIPLMASTFLQLSSRPAGRILVALLIGIYLAISIVSLPNITFRNLIYSHEHWLWPETNFEIRPIIDYWWLHRQPNEPIYVYYAGNQVFRYYLQVLNKEKETPPYNWTGDENYRRPTQPLNVAYGRWLRDRPAEELSADVYESLPAQTGPFWIIFMHVHGIEDSLLMKELLKNYIVDAQAKAMGSTTLYHLVPRK